MDETTPTTARRQLGALLRRLRLGRGLTLDRVASLIGVAPSQVSRIEKGARTLSPEYESQLIGLYQVPEVEVDALKALADAGRKRVSRSATRPFHATDYVKIEQTNFVELERDAVRIREFNSGHIPGLLQTEAYMRASMKGTAPDVDASSIENAVKVRKLRQERLTEGVAYEVILDEAALVREVGGPETMRAQASAICHAVVEGMVALSVIPFTAGAHPGANSQFVALTMPAAEVPDAVFSEGLFGHVEFNKSGEIERFDRVWARLSDLAESGDATMARLLGLAGGASRRV